MESGFIIKELRLSGSGLESASVTFNKGLNVISGPTNTGKSYIFQCINYMLGSSSKPKDIVQARKYESIFLELASYSETKYTLESDLKGGNFKLYKCSIDDTIQNNEYELLNRKHDPNNEKTVSAFLLSLNNLSSKKIRTNAKGKTRTISYRDIIRFLMVNEERIITQESPIVSHYTKETEELNTLKFLITGIDDSSIIEFLNQKQITHRKGKLELLNELILETKDLIPSKTNLAETENSLLWISKNIESLNIDFLSLKKQFSILESERQNFNLILQDKTSRYKVLRELIKRSNLLNEQYQSDIQRLKATIEASNLLAGNHTLDRNCPLCFNKIEEACDEEEILAIINSCQNEIYKIQSLKIELIESVNLMNSESEQLENEISVHNIKIMRLSQELDEGIGKQIDSIIKNTNTYNDEKSKLLGIKALQERYLSYQNQKEKIDLSIPKSNLVNQFDKLSTATNSILSDKILKVLKGCNYPSLDTVSYSEDNNDFVISGEDRNLSGKGYRAITYSAYIVGLQELINTKNYRIGVPVLDSPFVTYKKPKAGDEYISIDLAMDFYRYIAKSSETNQFIIIENEEPPIDLVDKINHITFSGLFNSGRFGFIPTNTSR